MINHATQRPILSWFKACRSSMFDWDPYLGLDQCQSPIAVFFSISRIRFTHETRTRAFLLTLFFRGFGNSHASTANPNRTERRNDTQCNLTGSRKVRVVVCAGTARARLGRCRRCGGAQASRSGARWTLGKVLRRHWSRGRGC